VADDDGRRRSTRTNGHTRVGEPWSAERRPSFVTADRRSSVDRGTSRVDDAQDDAQQQITH
jgi:hypothetical protein